MSKQTYLQTVATRVASAVVLTTLIAVYALPAQAAGGAMHYLDAKVNLDDRASLQNGARVFVNYCLSCHAMSYMRYNRIGEDLGLSDEQVRDNLMFAADKVVEQMKIAAKPANMEQWFGVVPPDLSVIARARGADYLYSYLVTFYQDSSAARPFGVDNVVLKGAAMPHVLWPLQGHQKYVKEIVDGEKRSQVTSLSTNGDEILVHREVTLGNDTVVHATDRLQVAITGSMQPGEFRSASRDLVNFLVYAGEPAQLKRTSIGVWVLLFLGVLFVLSRMLYKEYWKDVH
ncbi:MAG: ubiquinol-cytochrome c reductase cytochrome c1 subunit [Gammaproteobacteria bacterium]|jgi:ubiquinol-cytochrome c reductase cytochrome c1 subunit